MNAERKIENTSFYLLDKDNIENTFGGGVSIQYYFDENGNIKFRVIVN